MLERREADVGLSVWAGKVVGERLHLTQVQSPSRTHTFHYQAAWGINRARPEGREEPDQQAQELLGPGWGCSQRRGPK